MITSGKELFDAIMSEMGLSVDPYSYYIIDTDFNIRLEFGNKILKLNLFGNIHLEPNEMSFNPLSDLNVMKGVFDYYLDKLNQLGENYFPVHYPNQHPNRQTSLTAVRGDMAQFTTRPYSNMILCYCEMIFLISGTTGIDLTCLDSTDYRIRI